MTREAAPEASIAELLTVVAGLRLALPRQSWYPNSGRSITDTQAVSISEQQSTQAWKSEPSGPRQGHRIKQALAPVDMESERTFFITSNTYQRQPIFRYEAKAKLFLDVLYHYREQKKYLLHEYVIMPDHVHALITRRGIVARPRCSIHQGWIFLSCRQGCNGLAGQLHQPPNPGLRRLRSAPHLYP